MFSKSPDCVVCAVPAFPSPLPSFLVVQHSCSASIPCPLANKACSATCFPLLGCALQIHLANTQTPCCCRCMLQRWPHNQGSAVGTHIHKQRLLLLCACENCRGNYCKLGRKGLQLYCKLKVKERNSAATLSERSTAQAPQISLPCITLLHCLYPCQVCACPQQVTVAHHAAASTCCSTTTRTCHLLPLLLPPAAAAAAPSCRPNTCHCCHHCCQGPPSKQDRKPTPTPVAAATTVPHCAGQHCTACRAASLLSCSRLCGDGIVLLQHLNGLLNLGVKGLLVIQQQQHL